MKKVSMIMPCYNSAPYIDDMLESIVLQNYDSIELIAAYDSSTDNTLEKLHLWIPRFTERGYELKIVENTERLGITGGINKALPYFTGEFITFPDSDDYMFPDFVQTMVAALEGNPKYNWVRCDNIMVSDSEPKRIIEYTNSHNKCFEHLGMPLCLMLYLVPRSPWRMMAKADFFKRIYPYNRIFQHPSSHEVPLALPLAYAEEPLHVAKPLYKYILHSEAYTLSRHRSVHSCVPYFDSMEVVVNNCIEQLPAEKRYKQKLHDANHIYYLATKAYYCMNLGQTILSSDYSDLLLKAMCDFTPELIIPDEFDSLLYWRQFFRYATYILLGIYADETKDKEIWELLASGKVILYGAGKNCGDILKIIRDLGVTVFEIWDRNASEIICKDNINVINPASEIKDDTTIAVTILSRKFSAEAEADLLRRGCSKILDAAQISKGLRYGMIQKYFPNMITRNGGI